MTQRNHSAQFLSKLIMSLKTKVYISKKKLPVANDMPPNLLSSSALESKFVVLQMPFIFFSNVMMRARRQLTNGAPPSSRGAPRPAGGFLDGGGGFFGGLFPPAATTPQRSQRTLERSCRSPDQPIVDIRARAIFQDVNRALTLRPNLVTFIHR